MVVNFIYSPASVIL